MIILKILSLIKLFYFIWIKFFMLMMYFFLDSLLHYPISCNPYKIKLEFTNNFQVTKLFKIF